MNIVLFICQLLVESTALALQLILSKLLEVYSYYIFISRWWIDCIEVAIDWAIAAIAFFRYAILT